MTWRELIAKIALNVDDHNEEAVVWVVHREAISNVAIAKQVAPVNFVGMSSLRIEESQLKPEPIK